jgi:hypothetical protein
VSRRSVYAASALSLLTALLLAACSTAPSPAPATATATPPAPVVGADPSGLGEQSLTPWLCADIQDQYVVAHEDDDLLFMNPDLQAAIRLGHCTLTTFLTAGNDNKQGASGLTYMKQREEGIRQAYAKMAGQRNSWLEGNFFINNRKVKLYALAGDLRVVLLFFRLPDGADSDYNKTLAALNSSADGAITLQAIDGSNSYTKSQLVKTLADIMKYAQPKYLHIQDSSPDPYIKDRDITAGDHVDHVVGARLVQAAEQQYTEPHMLIRYRDYNINTETVPNLNPADQASKLSTFNVYAAKDPVICPQGNACITASPELSLYSFYGWTQRQYFNQDDNQQGSVTQGMDGRLQAFVIGNRSSTLRSITQTAPGSGSWNAWQDLKGNFSAAPIVAPYSDGRLAAFVHSNYGTMFYSGQNTDQSWTPWRELGGQGVSDAAATTDSAGRLRAVGVSNSGQIYEMSDATSRGAWSAWKAVGTPFYAASNPALALGQGGKLTLLALDSRGALRVNSQAAGSSSWPNSWQNLGGSFASAPVVTRNADGRLEVFLRGTDQGLYHLWQTATGPEALSLGGQTFSGQPVVSLAGGLLSVAVRDNQGHLSLLQQLNSQPGSAWSARQDLGTPTTFYGSSLSAVIGMGTNPDGTLALLARADDGNIYSTAQGAAGWNSWSNLGN